MRIRSLLRSKLLIPLVAVMLLLSVASRAWAPTFCVGCNTAGAGCDVLLPGIGAALVAANANIAAFDTVRVAFGTYPESDATTMPLLGLFPLPDTIRVLGGWDPADCATRADTIIPTNRTTTIIAAGSGGIFDVIAILIPFNLTVDGFTMTGGTGLVGVIGGAINMISAVFGSFTLTASNNIFMNNNSLIGGAVSALAIGLGGGSVSLQNNFCTDNTAGIHGGCYSSISAVLSAMSTQGRNNIIAQNASFFGGGQGLTSVAASSNTTQTRNNTVADNVAVLGGGDFQANIVGATNLHNAVNDMTISNITGAGLGNNEFIAGIGGVITILTQRVVNLGRNAAGDVLTVGGGTITGNTSSLPCDGAGANILGPEDSSVAQFVDPFASPPDYNLPVGPPESPCNTAGVKDTLGGEAPFPPTDWRGTPRDASIGASENPITTPTPTPTPGGPCSGSACEPGDANADGFVNLADLGVIINIFRGNQTGPGNGDCNEDGFTNLADLGCVITKFRG